MSYKIRYGYDRHRQISAKQIMFVQSLVSGVLLCLAAFARDWCGSDQMQKSIFYTQPTTLTEQAVAALSGALAEGEGWYQALAVWCRTVIDGAAV